eukprot:1160828-Pelagomonas_calceolata.AAC.16
MDRLSAYLLVMLRDMLARLQRYIDRATLGTPTTSRSRGAVLVWNQHVLVNGGACVCTSVCTHSALVVLRTLVLLCRDA